MSRRLQFSLKELMIAPVLVGVGFLFLLNSTSESWFRFAAMLAMAGAFLGAAVGVVAKRFWSAALCGASAWFLFAGFALVVNLF